MGCVVAVGCDVAVDVAAGVAVALGVIVAVDPLVAVAVPKRTKPELLLCELVVAVLCAMDDPPPRAPTIPEQEQQLQTISVSTAPTAIRTCATRGMLRELPQSVLRGCAAC